MSKLIELKLYKVTSVLHINIPNSVFFVKGVNDTETTGYVTTENGTPIPFKNLNSSGGSGITSITSTGNTLDVTGSISVKNIEVSSSLAALINSAIQSGDAISSLMNDAGYITVADIPIPTLQQVTTGTGSNETTSPIVAFGYFVNGVSPPRVVVDEVGTLVNWGNFQMRKDDWETSGILAEFNVGAISNNRQYILPDNSGVLALTSDIVTPAYTNQQSIVNALIFG